MQEVLTEREGRKVEIHDATMAALKRYRDGYMNLLALEVTLMGIGWPDHHIKRLLALA